MSDLAGLDARLAAAEDAVEAATGTPIRPGCRRRVVWAGAPGARAPLALVYVHGYSASPRELEPLPETVAATLGANLHLARLDGHGQDGPAMGRATLGAWRRDVAEALAVGRALGERVLVMGCSTGCTLLTLALADGEEAAGAVMLSPNFGVRTRRGQLLLDAPLVRTWVPRLLPGVRGEPAEGAASGVWTHHWPARALIPMAQAVRAVRHAPLDWIRVPALFAYSDADRVVDPARSGSVLARWGAPATRLALAPVPGGDPTAHVLAGPLSPRGTAPLAHAVARWWIEGPGAGAVPAAGA